MIDGGDGSEALDSAHQMTRRFTDTILEQIESIAPRHGRVPKGVSADRAPDHQRPTLVRTPGSPKKPHLIPMLSRHGRAAASRDAASSSASSGVAAAARLPARKRPGPRDGPQIRITRIAFGCSDGIVAGIAPARTAAYGVRCRLRIGQLTRRLSRSWIRRS
jgi:hypothetical protein